jgi:hypothetical protein
MCKQLQLYPTIMKLLATSLAIVSGVAAQDFNIFQHIGANAQWYPGTFPNTEHEALC